MENENRKKIVHISIVSLICVIILGFVFGIMLKYEIEGDKNKPFNLTKISVISTAIGEQKADSQNKWDLEIIQKNDIYFQIEKNTNFNKEDIIKNIKIENIEIIEKPIKGKVIGYMPNSEGLLYKYNSDLEIKDKLEFKGTLNTNMQLHEIANQGGLIGFSIAIKDLGQYISNDDETVVHDGTLLQKINISEEEIKTKVSFDFIIETEAERVYKSNITLELPIEGLIQNGSASIENTELKNAIFKRI